MMRNDEPRPDLVRQVDRLGRRHVARARPRDGSRPLIGRNMHVERLGTERLGEPVVSQAVSAMIQPKPPDLDDEPQIKMASPVVGVEPLVGRGDAPDASRRR